MEAILLHGWTRQRHSPGRKMDAAGHRVSGRPGRVSPHVHEAEKTSQAQEAKHNRLLEVDRVGINLRHVDVYVTLFQSLLQSLSSSESNDQFISHRKGIHNAAEPIERGHPSKIKWPG